MVLIGRHPSVNKLALITLLSGEEIVVKQEHKTVMLANT